MELHDESAEPQVTDDVEVDAVLQPHIRQVADRALPARQVLLQQREGRGRDEQAPVFVP